MAGCSEENISDRLYAEALGISGSRQLTLFARVFDEQASFSAQGTTIAEALRTGEAEQGGAILIGHTELLCMDGSRTLTDAQELLFSQGLSPACKVLCTDVHAYFSEENSTDLLRSIRQSEKNGLLAETELSTILEEWLGERETALLPVTTGDTLGMVLLHKDGTRTLLSETAACGMYWLRQHSNEAFTMTVKTEDGNEDIRILRSSLKKKASQSDGNILFSYTLTVYTDERSDALRMAAAGQILQQCSTAAREMNAAHADVIGLQELAAYYKIGTLPEQPRIRTEVIIK